jgi:hypothetical protein
MADTTSTSLNSLFATMYEDSVLAARENSPLSAIAGVYTDRQGIEARVFSERAKLSAGAIAEGVDLAASTFSKASTATLTPGEVGAQGVITDRAFRTDPRIRAELAIELGNAMAVKVDGDLAASMTAFTGATLGSNTTAVALTFQKLMAAQAILIQAGVVGPFYAAIHPYSYFEMANSVSLEQTLKNTPEAIKDELARKYYIGTLGPDLHLVMSPHQPLANDGGAVQYATNAVFPSMALALDWRDPTHIEPFRSPKGRKWEVNIVGDYAAGVAYPARGVKIYSKAVVPS